MVDNVLKYEVGGINIDECRVGGKGGRYPANIITDGSEEVTLGMPFTNSRFNVDGKNKEELSKTSVLSKHFGYSKRISSGFNDSGSAMRYFYCAKASTKDKDEGLEQINLKNIHTTVKPTTLMQYLIRLVAPKGAIILDPFNGSGSTGKACMYENIERNANYYYIGVEMTEEYLPVAKARIEYVLTQNKIVSDTKQKQNENTEQVEKETRYNNLFDSLL